MRETQSLHLHIICLRWRGEIRANGYENKEEEKGKVALSCQCEKGEEHTHLIFMGIC